MPAKPSTSATSPAFALFDSRDDSSPAGAWLLTQLREEVRCTDPSRWAACLQTLEDAARGGAWVALAAHYELGYAIEPRLQPLLPPEHGPLVTGWVFEHAEWLDDDACEAWLTARAGSDVGGTGRMQPGIGEADYLQQVERIRRYIAAGDCYQVNLTFPLDGEAFGNPARLYQALGPRSRCATAPSSPMPAAPSCRAPPSCSSSARVSAWRAAR